MDGKRCWKKHLRTNWTSKIETIKLLICKINGTARLCIILKFCKKEIMDNIIFYKSLNKKLENEILIKKVFLILYFNLNQKFFQTEFGSKNLFYI
jgi:hypothetical protein